MKIRLYNALILTMKDSELITGEVWINRNRIEYLGEVKETDILFDEEVDIKGNLLMPGFKNSHAHSAMTFARSYADDLVLDEWLHKKIFPLESKLKAKHVYHYSMLAYMEYISSGITSVFDMYYQPEAMMKASVDSGVRTVLCGAINNFKESPDILEKHYNNFNNKHELISYILGFHAEYTSSLSLMKDVANLAYKYKAPVYMHNSETKKEVQDCVDKYNLTPTKLFDKLGIYDFGGGGFHCIYLDEEDIDIFRKKNLNIITNTCSNLKLVSGVAPIYKYNEKKINLALGTDGAGSNNALDMFKEMYITAVLQKLSKNDVSALSTYEVLKMATVNGARAMGLYDCDYLDVGKKADIIAIDLGKPNMQPINNIVNSLVYSAGKHNVYMTMVNGKILFKNGMYTSIDDEKVYYNVNKLMKDLV